MPASLADRRDEINERKKVTLRLGKVSKSAAKIENEDIAHALSNVSIAMAKSEFISLVGLLLLRKFTILRLMAGLIQPATGRLTVDCKAVEMPSPERGMIFQKSTLFP